MDYPRLNEAEQAWNRRAEESPLRHDYPRSAVMALCRALDEARGALAECLDVLSDEAEGWADRGYIEKLEIRVRAALAGETPSHD